MEYQHDAIRHLKYLRQSLSQNNEAIGFFISAGCPLSVAMPETERPLIPDVKNLTIYINDQLSENEKYTVLLAEVEKAGKSIENIEDILSFLRSLLVVSKGGDVRGLSEDDLKKLEQDICSIIVQKLNVSLPDGESPYHRLGKWISSIDRKIPVELFTTNYDLLMEQALDDLEIPYFDGFVGSRRAFFDLRAVEDNLIPTHWSRLWKIHGSINWYQEEIQSNKKVHRTSEIKEDASHLIYPSHLKYEESRKMPYLALIDQLNRFIRKKSSFLILSGYSFRDGHLNDTIVNALKANPTAMVLGLMHGRYKTADGVEQYSDAYQLAKRLPNLNVWTFDKAIIGTNLGSWKNPGGDEFPDLQAFVSSEPRPEKPEENDDLIKLGDFSEFTNFLQGIISAEKDVQNG